MRHANRIRLSSFASGRALRYRHRHERMAQLSYRWLQLRANRRLLQANCALERAVALIRGEAHRWASGSQPVASLAGTLQHRLERLLHETTHRRQPFTPTPAVFRVQVDDTLWQAEMANLRITAVLSRLVEWAVGKAWDEVEESLPGSGWLRYDLSGRALAAAGVDPEAEQRRVRAEVAELTDGLRLNVALRVGELLRRQIADALYAWSDEALRVSSSVESRLPFYCRTTA